MVHLEMHHLQRRRYHHHNEESPELRPCSDDESDESFHPRRSFHDGDEMMPNLAESIKRNLQVRTREMAKNDVKVRNVLSKLNDYLDERTREFHRQQQQQRQSSHKRMRQQWEEKWNDEDSIQYYARQRRRQTKQPKRSEIPTSITISSSTSLQDSNESQDF
eukprot:CAMPEP_0116847820 /NCGR_PEP_ID=MMETSP0418-20121206/14643_1 /TAXON_ID=1158023 /ORGANISM="Astrosyne radiata, Strain 13vi08-1A" /LENGTH=161 /DNA_ID=CAMNT_0004479301 /DNA_START=1 /DNA_END=486 /DNA_ORIENTATION=+